MAAQASQWHENPSRFDLIRNYFINIDLIEKNNLNFDTTKKTRKYMNWIWI